MAAQVFFDASSWKEIADFYRSLFFQVGAPPWHGQNFNALRDSVIAGDINAVPPPCEIEIIGADVLPDRPRQFIRDFADPMADARAEGVNNTVTCKPPI